MIGIPLAVGVFAYGEWAAHKYLLHGLGRKRTSYFSVHFHEHHQAVRRAGGYDIDYEGPIWSTKTQAREAVWLGAVALAHLPLLPVAPFYTLTTWYLLDKYRRDHRRAHLDPEWGREHLPWHYDHHMGDQDKNWGVTFGWFDVLAGTREKFIGTEKDREDRARNSERATAVAAGRRERKATRKSFGAIVRELRREVARAA